MKIAIIGTGNMGGALARGLASGSMVAAEDIFLSNPSYGKLQAIKNDFPDVNVTTDNVEAVVDADLVVLAVKPWIVEGVIREIAPVLDYSRQAVASMVGGLDMAQLSAWLMKDYGELPTTYIVIPNTAIAAKSSMTFIASARSTEEMDNAMLDIFDELGVAMMVEEWQIAAGTSLASCGIAFAMRYVRAAMEGGVELGFRASDVQKIVMQTLKGAVDVLEMNGTHPEVEIDRVTTPGGLTIKGLNAMEHNGFTNSVIAGLKASVK